MVLIRVGTESWGARLRRAASAVVLGSVIFMLGAAGSKNSPSLPPTLDPSIACKRPKTATPYFPSIRARDLLRARLAPFAGAPLFEESRIPDEFGPSRERPEPEGRNRDMMRSPRYLRPYLASIAVSSVSPPA